MFSQIQIGILNQIPCHDGHTQISIRLVVMNKLGENKTNGNVELLLKHDV